MPLRDTLRLAVFGPLHAPVAREHGIGLQAILVRFDGRHGVRAADLFLALPEEGQIDRRRAVDGGQRLDRLDERDQVGLHVSRAAGVNPPVAHRRFEGRTLPKVERISRLDIVMPVDQDRRFARRRVPCAEDHWMTGSLDQFNLGYPCLFEPLHDPFRAAPNISGMLRGRANARNPQQLQELLVVRIPVRIEIALY